MKINENKTKVFLKNADKGIITQQQGDNYENRNNKPKFGM